MAVSGGVGLFHPGRQHSWQTVLALQEASALQWFATALFYQKDRWPYRIETLLPNSLRVKVKSYFQKIASAEIDARLVRTVNAYEWSERAAAKAGLPRLASTANRLGNSRFQRGILKLLQREPAQRLWGYDTSCADVFAAMRGTGVACILDRSIGHPRSLRRIIAAEQANHPEFFVGRLGLPTDADIAEADREVAGADHIVVGSQFCADTLIDAGAEARRIHIVPYGYDSELFAGQKPDRPSLGTLPVKFLFVGAISARKGVHHLFEAFRRIPRHRATLTVAGSLAMPAQAMARYSNHIDYLGHLSREQVAEQFRHAHCFIFPSLFEGSAVVLCEAIAAGLGIVQSRAAGDGVRSGAAGANGVVLESISADTIQAAVEDVIARPEILRQWSDASWALRPQRSWQAYRRYVGELLPSLVRQ